MSTKQRLFRFVQNGLSAFGSRKTQLVTLALASGLLAHAGVVVGYYQGGNADAVPPKNLVANGSAAELTHIIYAFAVIQKNTNNTYSCSLSGNLNDAKGQYNNSGAYYAIQEEYTAARSVSGVADTQSAPSPWIGPNDPGYSSQPKAPTVLQGVFHQLQEMKAKYPNLKVLVSIGGENASGDFSSAAASANATAFVNSCVSMFIDGNFGLSKAYPGIFDGIDIDWETPASSTDIANYSALLSTFQTKLSAAGSSYLLTTTVVPGDTDLPLTGHVNVASIARYVDYVNVMSYDYMGSWSGGTGFDAPLYASPLNTGSSYNISSSPWHTYNVSDTFAGANNGSYEGFVTQFKNASVPTSKLLLGIPFYGLQWDKVAADTYHGVFEQGSFVNTPSYAQISQQFLGAPGYTQYCDYGSSASPYECSPNTGAGSQETWLYDGASNFVSFDNETSVTQKVDFAKNMGLGGVMMWDLSQDSPGGCLMSAISTANGIKPANQDTSLYNFESGVQGWTHSTGIFSVIDSEGEAFEGCKSLGVNFNESSFEASATAYILSPAGIKPGQTITMHIWIPAGSQLVSINSFITNTSWTWLASDYQGIADLKAGQWNTLSFTVPANAPTTFGELGVEFDSSEAWTGRVYIDSVTN